MDTSSQPFFHRFSNDGSSKPLTPISVKSTPECTLDEALSHLSEIVPDLESFAFSCRLWVDDKFADGSSLPHGLNHDEATAIHLYTTEWEPRQDSLYYQLNVALREPKRTTIKPFLPFLKIFFSAFSKLPSFRSNTSSLWRGFVGGEDLASQYEKGKKFWWWSFSSCTHEIESAKRFTNNFGCGDSQKKKFMIQIHFRSHVVDIREFSGFPDEAEILVLPGRFLKVENVSALGEFTLVECFEEKAPNMILGIDFPQWDSSSATQNGANTSVKTGSIANADFEKTVAERVAAEKASLEKANAERVASLEKALAEKAASEKANAERVASLEKAFAERTAEKIAMEKVLAEHVERALAEELKRRANLRVCKSEEQVKEEIRKNNHFLLAPEITTLKLYNNNIGDSGAECIASSLKENKTLTLLLHH
eukprot:TRINITY_DN423_c0_g2_i3.p1 TRINITY_DN423_c0_g2~~TRINITY_DN423_c0_g2_i3.p1  ORF type:complete len:423 (+),score=105.60 TRINITY_DN423_c0_g2_i3:70-1338(+)